MSREARLKYVTAPDWQLQQVSSTRASFGDKPVKLEGGLQRLARGRHVVNHGARNVSAAQHQDRRPVQCTDHAA